MRIYAIHDKKADFIISIFAQVCDEAAVHSMRQMYATADVPFFAVKDTELLLIANYDEKSGFCEGTSGGELIHENPGVVCDLAELYLDVKSDDISEDSLVPKEEEPEDDVPLTGRDLFDAFYPEGDNGGDEE